MERNKDRLVRVETFFCGGGGGTGKGIRKTCERGIKTVEKRVR